MARSPQLQVILDDLDGLTERAVRRVSFNLSSNLIQLTPRDTGWAAANWVPSLGGAVQVTYGSKTAVDGGAQQRGLAAIAGYRASDGLVFVTNNVPYIQLLNDGHSAKAPVGFVEISIDMAIRQSGL